MRPRPALRFLAPTLFLCLGLSVRADTGAATKPSTAPSTRPAEVGFTPLFNGTDLSGWVYGTRGAANKVDKYGAGYQVDGGVVYCTTKDGGNLYTEKEYADFDLRFEFKLSAGANNGIGIRAPLTDDTSHAGIEIQILDDTAPEHAHLRPAQYHGSVYDIVPAKRGFLKPVGEWNDEEIIADGRHITIVLNGTTIVDANLDDVKDPQVIQKHPGMKNRTGHLCLIGHHSRVDFRNLRIKTP